LSKSSISAFVLEVSHFSLRPGLGSIEHFSILSECHWFFGKTSKKLYNNKI